MLGRRFLCKLCDVMFVGCTCGCVFCVAQIMLSERPILSAGLAFIMFGLMLALACIEDYTERTWGNV